MVGWFVCEFFCLVGFCLWFDFFVCLFGFCLFSVLVIYIYFISFPFGGLFLFSIWITFLLVTFYSLLIFAITQYLLRACAVISSHMATACGLHSLLKSRFDSWLCLACFLSSQWMPRSQITFHVLSGLSHLGFPFLYIIFTLATGWNKKKKKV